MALITADVNVSGGEKLRAHLDGVQGGRFLAALVRNYREQYRRQIIPALRARTPKRSERLSKSFRTGNPRRGAGFTLQNTAPYVNFVRFREPRKVRARTVNELARNVWRPKANALGRRAGALALREVT